MEQGGLPGGSVAETSCPSAGGLCSMPGLGTRSHMQQLSVHMLHVKDPTRCY